MTPAELTIFLRRHHYRLGTEAILQQSLADTLQGGGLVFEREVRLSPGERIDFLVAEGIGIEAKTRYPRRAIYRQLERYARHDQIKALILVTGTAIGLPDTLGGKPLFYVSLGRSAL